MNDFDTHEKKDLLYKLQSGYLTAFTRVYHHYSKILSNLTGIRLKNLAGPRQIGFLIDNKIIEKLRSTELQHGLMREARKLPAKDIVVFRSRGERRFIQKQTETKQIKCMT